MVTLDQREFHSLADFHAYVLALAARRPEEDPVVQAWLSAKRLTWLALLVGAFLIYHLVSTMSEVVSLPELSVSVPTAVTAVARPKSAF